MKKLFFVLLIIGLFSVCSFAAETNQINASAIDPSGANALQDTTKIEKTEPIRTMNKNEKKHIKNKNKHPKNKKQGNTVNK